MENGVRNGGWKLEFGQGAQMLVYFGRYGDLQRSNRNVLHNSTTLMGEVFNQKHSEPTNIRVSTGNRSRRSRIEYNIQS